MPNYIGSIVSVAPGIPATFTKAGYEALTWTVVNGAGNAPGSGMETALIDVPDLASGLTKREKGASVGVETEMTFRDIGADAGQTLIRTYAAVTYGLEVSVRVVLPSGAGANTHVYMSGIMYSLRPNDINTENFIGFKCMFTQNYPEVRAAAPA